MHVSSGGSDGWFQFGHQGDIRSNGPWPRLMLGEATYFNDGNINGSIWGGYLSNYLNQNFVRDVRLGNVESIATWRGPGYSDSAGYVLTGAANNNVDEYIDVIFRRPLQNTLVAIGLPSGAFSDE
ncbi:phage tail protein [Serratia ureilytica]